jgi:peptide-methionine (S)-S-oxide reductase
MGMVGGTVLGRLEAPLHHFVNGRPLKGPYPPGSEQALFAMGCFWGAERLFWEQPGVWVTAVGYSGGKVPDPSYERVCSGLTGHAETVLVVYEPEVATYAQLLKLFWENHDPTQGMRQGNDVGPQYRSAIFYYDSAQAKAAAESRERYDLQLHKAGYPHITTEVTPAGPFYFAEGYHQQYLAKNPNGYCGLGGTGVACPVGLLQGQGEPRRQKATPA